MFTIWQFWDCWSLVKTAVSCEMQSSFYCFLLFHVWLFAVVFIKLVTYLCPSLPVGHRPSTTPRNSTLFWAALAIPVQLVPCCFSSTSVSRLQQLRDRPLFLFPWGFQIRASRVVLDDGFLRVCPTQTPFPPQYLLGHWFLSRSLPQIFISDLLRHRILQMRLRQVLKNVWIFCCIVCVVHHVSN